MSISIEEIEMLKEFGATEEEIIQFDKDWEEARDIIKIIQGND